MPFVYWVCRMSVRVAANQFCGVLCVGNVQLGYTGITGYYKKISRTIWCGIVKTLFIFSFLTMCS